MLFKQKENDSIRNLSDRSNDAKNKSDKYTYILSQHNNINNDLWGLNQNEQEYIWNKVPSK